MTLTTGDAAHAPVPASVMVTAGQTSATFAFTTGAVTTPASVAVSASYGGATATGTLAINPAGVAVIPVSCGQTLSDSLTLTDGASTNPAFAGTGTHYARRYTFTPTVSGNYVVTLTTSGFDPALSLITGTGYTASQAPGQGIFALTGGTAYAFEVSTGAPGQTGAFTLHLGCPQSGVPILSVKNGTTAVPNDATLSGTAVSFGTTPQGVPVSQTFTLLNTGGSDLGISSLIGSGDYQIVGTVPSLIPAGGQASLTLRFNATSQGTSAGSIMIGNDSAVNPYQFRITATATASGSLPAVTSVTPATPSVTGGSPVTETVTLSAAAPSGGLTVSLTATNVPASNTAVPASVPASVTFGPGKTTATFAVTTVSVSAAATVSLAATLGTSTASAILTVNPSGTPPTITLAANQSTAVAPGSFTLTPTVTPATGSTITKVEFFANNVKIGETTQAPYAFNWTNVPASTNPYVLTAKVTDNHGLTGTTSATVTVTVNAGAVLTVTISPNGGTFTTAQTVTLAAQNSSGGAVAAKIYYTLDGNVWQPYIQPLTIVHSTIVTAKATADTYANSASATATFTINSASGSLTAELFVSNGSTTADSAIAASATTISAPTPVLASLSAASTWQLAYRLEGDTAWMPFATNSNSAALSKQTLTTWDTTLLVNGLYQVQLSALDSGGHTATAQVEVLVQGGQKVGYFTLSYNDLTVPVAGFPLSITRTYDSRVKTPSDFGVGWTLSTNNIRLQQSSPSGYNWTTVTQSSNVLYNPVKAHLITITLPDGATYNFQEGLADPSFSVFQISDVDSTTVTYTPLTGTHATLAPVGVGTDVLLARDSHSDDPNQSDPNGIELEDLDGNVYKPTEFLLTTRDGRQFDIVAHNSQQAGGLQWIRDLNGNTLSFSASGITSTTGTGASGPAVTFQRTGNTITSISVKVGTQTGPAITYAQDGNGDLKGVTDRAGNTTTYDYDPTHLLTGIHDPRGLTPLTNHYDTKGRLLYSTDANGHNISYDYPVSLGGGQPANTEATTDRLGNQTVLGYDPYGNVNSTIRYLKKSDGTIDHSITTSASYTRSDLPDKKTQDIDALGRQTDYVYDSLGNLLTVTQYRTKGVPASAITTSTTYNSFGQPLTVTDPLGHVVSTNHYDPQGNLLWTRDALGHETDFQYNTSSGTLAATTDAKGNVTQYGYGDPNNPANVTQVTDAQKHSTSFTYDFDGNKKSQFTTRLNSVTGQTEPLLTQFQYDGDDHLTLTTAPDGATSQTFYNSLGKVDHTLDALGRTTFYHYDNLGQLTSTTYPDSLTTSVTYDLDGQRIASTDKAGRMSATVYDSLGRVVMSGPVSSFPAGGSPVWLMNGSTPLVSQTYYDDAGQVTSQMDALLRVSSTLYDDLGRTAKSMDALGDVTQYQYDDAGRQLSVTDANLHTTSCDYDDAGRLLTTHYPDKSTSSTGYDELGRRISQTDQAGHTTLYAYDTLGRLASVTDPMGHISQFGYDALGEKTSQTDANGHITYFAYDIRGRLLSKMLPLGQSDNRSYDALGRLSTQTDFNGKVTAFSYDPASGRLLSKTAYANASAYATNTPTGEGVSFTYNADGTRHTAIRTPASGAAVTTTYGYYANGDYRQGQLSTVTTASGSASWVLSYSYDTLGNKSSTQTPSLAAGSKFVTYGYDALNRLQTVTHPDGAVTTFGYDKAGNRQSVSRAISATAAPFSTTSYTYDSLNRLTDIVNSSGNNAIVSSYHYQLRADGKRLSVTDASGTTNYTYDDQGKLKEENGPYADIQYGYDNVGNRLTRTVTGSKTVLLPNGVTTNTYDQNDRIATVNGSATHSYDLDGNEKTVAGQTASYDFENHLVSLASVANGTVLESYAYDADGNRYSVYISANTPTTTSYVVDTSLPYASVVEEYSGSTLAARYDYGDDLVRMDRSSPSVSTSYYLYDGLGSTRQLVSTTGAPTDTWGYSAFGELAAHTPSTGGTVNPFLFNAQQFDTASGNYYLRARYYDQSNGRFVSQDPYDGSDDDPVSLHRYLYAGCNPVDNVDPSGNDFGEIDTLVANGIAAEEDAIITPATANIIASQFAGRAALSFATSPAGVFAARAILTSFVGIPAILISAAAVESAFASEDDDDDEQKPNYYFRGTSVGFPGGANAQKFQVSETSSDPAIATAFALNKQSYGGTTIVEAASRDDLTGLEITKAPDMTFGQELGWYVFTPPTDFAARASIKISSQSSRTILQGMGVSLSYITYSRDDLTQQLRALDGHHLSEPQIQSYVAQAKAIGN